MDGDLGKAAIERIAQLWQVDEDRIEQTEHGFDWWPSKYRVSVTAHKSAAKEYQESWRLVIRTAFLTNLNFSDPDTRRLVSLMGSFAPTYSWVYTPSEISEEYKLPRDTSLRFQSTVYLREDTFAWLPDFLAKIAILQPTDAHRLADSVSEMLHGKPEVSGPGDAENSDHFDDMLNVVEAVYAPKGREKSRWSGSTEFAEIAERFGRSDRCYGNGDPNGLTLETPVGDSSALIRLQPDIEHPALGTGLLASMKLPFAKDKDSIIEDSRWLNFFESTMWTNVPQLSSWHLQEASDGNSLSSNAIFLPNIMYGPGLATNLALWQVGRANWAKSKLYPDLKDLSMIEILERRFAAKSD